MDARGDARFADRQVERSGPPWQMWGQLRADARALAACARGFSPADVEKILGGNVLRVLEANEKR